MIIDKKSKVIVNRYLIGDAYLMILKTKLASRFYPGSRINLHYYLEDPALFRSYAVAGVDLKEKLVKVVYYAHDKSSYDIAEAIKTGETVMVSGPKGTMPKIKSKAKNILLISDRYHVSATAYMAQYLKKKNKKVYSLIGGGRQEVIISENLLMQFHSELLVVNDTEKYFSNTDNELFFGALNKVLKNKIDQIVIAGNKELRDAVLKIAEDRGIMGEEF